MLLKKKLTIIFILKTFLQTYWFILHKNTHPFYQEASIILNLSDVNLWVETFGLTILEGMAYQLPAIVPPVGGVIELVEENKNGFLIDSKDIAYFRKNQLTIFK